MKNGSLTKLSVICFLGSLLFTGCCCINIGGCWPRAKYEKTLTLQAPLESGSTVVAKTSYGSITAEGADVTDCNVIAQIRVQAPTETEAAEIAEDVKIRLERDGKELKITADKPHVRNNRSISISYKMTVPRQTNLDCSSSYGSLELSDVNGDIEADTSYGSIKCAGINGQMRLDTSYGRIKCRDIISLDIDAHTSYGNIDIEYSDKASGDTHAKLRTSYGDVSLQAPPDFAGEVDLGTNHGSVKTDLPITVKGKISNTKIKGTISEGNGKLCLKTSFGSIKIR